jgi:hypothetical protein
MALTKNIQFQLTLLPVISLLLSFCSSPISETHDEKAIQEYEIELESLMIQIRDLEIIERPDEFCGNIIRLIEVNINNRKHEY